MATGLIRTEDIPSAPERVDVHAPDSLTILIAGDIRSTLMAGRSFVMQVAHPLVGAGVGQLSNFRNNPWHRLREIRKSGERFAFSGRAAGVAEGKRLRELHRDIKGVDSAGRAFHSLRPDVYGWVHAVFLDTLVTQCRLYGTALTRREEERLFEEWRESGRLFGLRTQDMPASLDAYWRHYEEMIADTLEYNDVIASMLALQAPPPEALSWLPGPVWRALWEPAAALNRKLTLAALPPAFRAKIGAQAPWTAADARQMRRLQAAVRTLVPRLPARLRCTAAGYRARQAQ